MAMYDWNHDGKKDGIDNFIEYNIYKESTGQSNKNSYSSGRGGGISGFGAILSVIAGLVGQVIIYMALGIEVEDVPVIVMIILWIVISSITGAILDSIGV